MGKLKTIELFNFKSYKGTQTIDLCGATDDAYFTSIIGPNGSGKSNMMDAISFVLGIRSSHLRSSQLKDLIYRDRISGQDVSEGVSEMEEREVSEEDDQSRTAYVSAVYETDSGKIIKLRRNISANGVSSYHVNNRSASFEKYSRVIEHENILIKARNFLVFQGDVEAIASQSPKDLTKLIEQISGSLDFKAEYDRLKDEQEQAAEASTVAFSKKRSYNAEIKQYTERKNEAESFQNKIQEREEAIITHTLWKLYHYDQSVLKLKDQITNSSATISSEAEIHQNLNLELDNLQTAYAKSQRDLQKMDRKIRTKEKDLSDKRNSLLPVDEKISLTKKSLRNSETRYEEMQRDYEKQETSVQKIKKDLRRVQMALEKFEEESRVAAEKQGLTLSDAEQAEYEALRDRFNQRASSEKSKLDQLTRQLKTSNDILGQLSLRLENCENQKVKFNESLSSFMSKKYDLESSIEHISRNLASRKSSYNKLIADRQHSALRETELDEKLQECIRSLLEYNADIRETERERKLRENVVTLQRLFPGVKGSVYDLCKPKQKKYEVAVATVLGKNFDAIIVDSVKTAQECISYMKEQRSGVASFIPLDTVTTTAVNTSLRGLDSQVRLAIDTVDYDTSIERAISYICGNATICDTLEVAKNLRWQKNIDTKAVTLDGSIIHKAGLMTGGRSSNDRGNMRKWEEGKVESLQNMKDNLMASLNEINKTKHQSGLEEERFMNEISKLEEKLTSTREELESLDLDITSKEAELRNVENQLNEIAPQVKQNEEKLLTFRERVEAIQIQVDGIEDSIFNEFCSKIGVENIREYEKTQGTLLQHIAQERLEYSTQQSRLENQLEFEQERLDETALRVKNIRTIIKNDTELLESLVIEKSAIETQVDDIDAEIEILKEEVNLSKAVLDESLDEVAEAKNAVQKSHRQLELSKKLVQTLQSNIERTISGKLRTLRTCKLEGIELPLLRGSLDDIPLTELGVVPDASNEDSMDIDSQTTGFDDKRDYTFGILVDFTSLSEEEKSDASEAREDQLQLHISNLSGELELMAPDMKAVNRLANAENELSKTEQEFDLVRKKAREAKELFNQVKKERFQKFNAAYQHIATHIDNIYKELTKSESYPLGGSAFLSLEDVEEPYLDGVKYHAMPPMKRFRDMELLSGGEKTMAALALLFAIHSYHPSPFFVLDEVDAALDNANVSRIANYIIKHAGNSNVQANGSNGQKCQFIVISLKNGLFEHSDALVGIYREQEENSSKALTIDLRNYPDV